MTTKQKEILLPLLVIKQREITCLVTSHHQTFIIMIKIQDLWWITSILSYYTKHLLLAGVKISPPPAYCPMKAGKFNAHWP